MTVDDPQTIIVEINREDALVVAMGGLSYVAAKMEGKVAGGGSPMALRRKLRNALADKGWWPE